jgi:hypothetical protein
MDRTVAFQVGRLLVIAGVVLVAIGLLFMTGVKWNFFGLGRLPGDIHYRGRNVEFHFPVVTCLVLSVALTLLFWVISFFTKK